MPKKILLFTLVCLAVLAVPSVASATSTPPGWVTMVSESGDYIGQGHNELFDDGTVGLDGGLGYVSVHTPTPAGGVFGYTIEFAPPSGQDLQIGEYDNAERYPFEPVSSPGLTVSGDGRGCNEDFGRFIIKDIHVDGGGVVDRFWALYEQHCENAGAPALFGEIKLGEPVSANPETAEPSEIDWPSTPVGVTGTSVPVTVVAGGSGATVSSVSLGGTNPSDFAVQSNGCNGSSGVLAAGGRCTITVAPHPTTSGDRSAQLSITDSGAHVTNVPLVVHANPTTTTTVEPSLSSSIFGTPITFNAGVASTSPGTPTGDVDFSAEGFGLGSAVLGGNGHTSGGPVAILDVGGAVTASYVGDSSFGPSEGMLAPNVQPAHTSITLTSSANPAPIGSSVTITAKVSNTDTSIVPFGSVQFFQDGAPILYPLSLDDNGETGIIGKLPTGRYVISAQYIDDTAAVPDFVGSNTSFTQTVGNPPPAPVAGTTTSGTQPGAPGAAVVPSNSFVLGKPTTSRGVIVIPAQSHTAGQYTYVAKVVAAGAAGHTAKARLPQFGSGMVTAGTGGSIVKLRIAPGVRARRLLARHKQLSVKVTVRFRSILGGLPGVSVLTVTVKPKKRVSARGSALLGRSRSGQRVIYLPLRRR